MTWFRVDDRLGQSRKVLSIRRSIRLQAMGLWSLAGAWSAGEESDGFVPEYMVEELGGDADVADALVASGLWEAEAEGFRFHNWDEWQPTREQLDAKREAERARKADWRARKAGKAADSGASRGSSPEVSHGTDDGTDASVTALSSLTRPDPTRPDPTRPDPTPVGTDVPTGGGTRKRAQRIPDEFVVTAAMRAWAAERTPLVDVNSATERFVNHWRAKAGKDATKLDWIATWRNWLIRDQEDRASRQKLTPTARAAVTVQAGREVMGKRVTSLALEAAS